VVRLRSGTLVAENVVLTAAHCTDFLGPGDLRVSFDPDPDEGSTYYDAAQIVVHPNWFTAPSTRSPVAGRVEIFPGRRPSRTG